MDRLECIWDRLKRAEKPILIYGMGDGCDKILAVCRAKGIPVQGIFVSDDHVRNKVVHSFPLLSYSDARKKFGEMIVLLAFGVFREDLMEKIVAMSRECELLVPEVPLFGGGLFDSDFFREHQKELDAVEEMLSDETSKKVFQSLVEYKLSGRIPPLFGCVTQKEEEYASLIPYRAGDAYLDLGAYDGDTVLEWHRLFPDHGKILAVEPNPKTFRKLVENTKDIPLVSHLEKAAWNRTGVLPFWGKSGRSAALFPEGNLTVKTLPVDEMPILPDFIKFDVEGAEKEAIEGAAKTIRETAPTLCISSYHRTEDLFAIPLQVKGILPDYKVYLRHRLYLPAWDTVYYFVGR